MEGAERINEYWSVMVGKTKSRTKEEQRRFQAIKEIGCIPCRMLGYYNVPCDIQHCISGGKRRGHSYSYGCCPYHHRNVTDLDKETAYRIFGPSLATNKKEFIERFGSDDELIAEQNRLIAEWENSFV